MGAVAEGSPSIRAQANLSALGLHEMAAWTGFQQMHHRDSLLKKCRLPNK